MLIGRIAWGADVSIDCAYEGAAEINAPLRGSLASRRRGEQIRSQRGSATVFAPDDNQPITHWSADCEVIGVKFDSAWLSQQARVVCGRDLAPLPAQLDIHNAQFAEWLRLVQSLHAAGVGSSAVAAPLASAVATSFLLAVTPDAESSSDPPGAIQRIVDALGDDPGKAWTAADMARSGGISVRRMQQLFADELGRSPRQVLLNLRLDRARTALRTGTRVSETATDLGFTNIGRFSAAYRDRFGILPSAERST